MNLPSLSTSSSEPRLKVMRALQTLAWIVASFAAIDLAINLAFQYPQDPKVTEPGRFQMYFEYGRSSEGKLQRMTGTSRTNSAPITLAGWYSPIEVQDNPIKPNAPIITFYGMSHSVRLADALNRTSNHFAARSVGAPGATTNWAYGAFLRDRGGGKSRAVVLSLMSANLPMINTVSPLTWNVSFPMPYTADRFYVKNGTLAVVRPPYESFSQYIKIFRSPAKWDAALKEIAANDAMYDEFLVRKSALDRSSAFRLVRRAYGQRAERMARANVLGGKGFNPDSEQIKLANAIVRDFAIKARQGGMIPVVFIVNNQGYSDTLFRALTGTLEKDKIPYLSSHTVVSPTDPRGYLADSHFTEENDNKLARALEGVIQHSINSGVGLLDPQFARLKQ